MEATVESFSGQTLTLVSTATTTAPSGSATIEVTDDESATVSIDSITTGVTEGGTANVVATLHVSGDGTPTLAPGITVSANLPGNGDYLRTAAVFGAGTGEGTRPTSSFQARTTRWWKPPSRASRARR